MEQLKAKAEHLTEHVKEYVETYFKLGVIKITDKATGFAAVSIMGILVCFLSLCILFFLGIGVALWLGEVMNNLKAGYFIVAGFYILVTVILIASRESLLFPFVRNFIIRKVYE
jgi:hypothetical protein